MATVNAQAYGDGGHRYVNVDLGANGSNVGLSVAYSDWNESNVAEASVLLTAREAREIGNALVSLSGQVKEGKS